MDKNIGNVKNILWTGSHGFIAGYAIQKLLDEGHSVWGIDNFWKYGPIKKSYDENPRFHFTKGDAKDTQLISKIIRDGKINIVVLGAAIIGGIAMFHELAYDLISENEKITCATFDACVEAMRTTDHFEKVVVISSSMVYENTDSFPSKESDLVKTLPPSSTYGFQKLAVEYFAKGAFEQYKLPFTIIRPFNAIGIGEKRALVEHEHFSGNIKLAMSHVVPDLVQKILKGQYPLKVFGLGNQVRHYTYAGDLADGFYRCIVDPRALNNDFNVSTPVGHNVLELAKAIWDKIGKLYPDDLQFQREFKYETEPGFAYDVQKRVPDVSKSYEVLGVDCKTSLEEALDEIIPWIKEQIELNTI